MNLFRNIRLDLLRFAYLSEMQLKNPLKVYLLIFSPKYIPVLLYRLAHAMWQCKIPVLPSVLSFINLVLFGIEIAKQARIGPGLFLPHTNGTVIGAYEIGANAIIYQNVTLGSKTLAFDYTGNDRPTVGDNVVIGSGSKVLGGIRLGSFVTVAANSVVINSVDTKCVVAGVPARVVRIND